MACKSILGRWVFLLLLVVVNPITPGVQGSSLQFKTFTNSWRSIFGSSSSEADNPKEITNQWALAIRNGNEREIRQLRLKTWPRLSLDFEKWNGYPLLHYAVLQPWHFACLRKYSQANLRIINWILKIPHIDVNVKDQKGNTALMAALADPSRMSRWIIQSLLKTPNINVNVLNTQGDSALSIAFKNPNEWEEIIASPNFNVNLKHAHGLTPLMLALYYNISPAALRLMDWPDIDVDAISEYDGSTALHLAATSGHFEVAKAILNVSIATLNAPTTDGVTPLFRAVQSYHANSRHWRSPHEFFTDTRRRLNLIQLLLDQPGVDVNAPRKSTLTTPLMMAVDKRWEDIVEVLLRHPKVDLHRIRKLPMDQEMMHRILMRFHNKSIGLLVINHPSFDANLQDDDGNTPFMCLLQRRQIMMREAGVKMSDRNDIPRDSLMIELLKQANLDINLRNKVGETALMQAIYNWDAQSVALILQHHKIDLSISNKIGLQAIDFAIFRAFRRSLAVNNSQPNFLHLFQKALFAKYLISMQVIRGLDLPGPATVGIVNHLRDWYLPARSQQQIANIFQLNNVRGDRMPTFEEKSSEEISDESLKVWLWYERARDGLEKELHALRPTHELSPTSPVD